MKKSLIQGLNERDMTAVLNSLVVNDFYYPTLFPLKFTATLTWKILSALSGAPVMAEVVSFGASAIKKNRDVVNRLQGDIQKIDVRREKDEIVLNEYYQLLQFANTVDGARELVNYIYEDVEFCFKAVNARLEWLALRAASTGQIILTKANSAGIITEGTAAVDFGIPTAQKTGVTTTWTTSATAKPISDLKAKIKLAKPRGGSAAILMDQDTFDNLAAAVDTQKYVASYVATALNLQTTPTLPQVNTAIAGAGLPPIKIIDQQLTFEDQAGNKTTVTPWEPGVVAIVPSLTLGNTFYGPQADDMVAESVAVKSRRQHILVKKYSKEEPEITEVTRGKANAFPALSSPDRFYLMDTGHANFLTN